MITGFVPNYLEEIKQRLSVVDLISVKVSLKKAGKNFKGLCPFHSEKSGSFFVFPQTESYYCFGCHASGDIFTFTMQTEGLAFGDAVEMLANRAGVALPERANREEKEENKKSQEKERLRDINAAAATYFSHLLLNYKGAERAREYLLKRGVTQPSIETFNLGYALDEWDSLLNYLTGKGYSHEELANVGLVGQTENGKYYDRFRGRLIFPIRDRQGNIIAFGGRVLEGTSKDAPKYLNSPQTILFDKSATLYGFDRAKDAIRRSDRAIIVEGYLDVVIAHQYGFENVVAPLGTALNEKHITNLKKLTRRLILALDADTAGQMATLKGIETAKQGFDTVIVPVPTSRGLVRFEQQVDAEIRVATLPVGKDPDEVIREDRSKFRDVIDRAQPVVDYYFSSVAANTDLRNAKGKKAALDQLLPAITEVRDRIEREHYIQKLARLIQVDAELVRGELNRVLKADFQRSKPKPSEPFNDDMPLPDNEGAVQAVHQAELMVQERDLGLEDYLLAYLLRYPEGLEVFGADGRKPQAEDFTLGENRMLFALLNQFYVQGRSLGDVLDELAPSLAQHLVRMDLFARQRPEIVDVLEIRQVISKQLDRVRDEQLRRVCEEASLALESEAEDPALSEEEISNNLEIFSLVQGVNSKRKLYYPKPSVVFRDSRNR
jgi:DNA primase